MNTENMLRLAAVVDTDVVEHFVGREIIKIQFLLSASILMMEFR